MAKTASKDTSGQDLAFEARRVAETAYASVKGREHLQSFLSFTFEEALDQQIEQISGKPRNGRPNELEVVEKTHQELLGMIDKIKAIPPEFFDEHHEDKDVNTKE